MADYVVERVQPTVYLDKSGNPVNGFVVFVAFPEFDETFTVNVPSIDPKTVKAAVEALLTQRRALAEL